MNLFNRRVHRKLSSLVLIGLVLLNVVLLAITIAPVSGLPQITLKWAKATGTGSTVMGPLAADLNNDGLMEIVKTGENGIAVLNPITGNVIWSAPYGGYHCPPEIIDLDKDGLPEVLVPGDGIVALRGNNGSVYWHNYNAAGDGHYMAVADIDADGYPEIYSATQGKITALTHDGRIFAQTSTYYTCWGGMSIGDTDFDGVFEVYLGERSEWYPSSPSGGRGLRAFWASNLTERWSYPDILCSSQAPILADVDGDGKLEIIVCNQNRGGIAVIRTDGSIYRKQDSILPGYGCHSNPPVFDVDGDGNLELVACGDASQVPSKPWIWDLVDWKRDAVLPFLTVEPPGLADVDGDGKVEIIDCTPSNVTIFKYNSASTNYDIIGTIPLGGAQAFSIAQDIDGDGKLELVFTTTWNDYVYAYDVETPAPIPRPRTGLTHYSQYRTRSPFYTPPPGPQKPFLDNEQPADGSTGVEFNPILSIRVRDWQQDLMNITFRTNATTGVWHDIGKYTNVGNGVYSQATTGMSSGNTKYWWSVEAEDSKGLSDEKIFSFTTRPPASWWDSAWKNRKLITIDPSKVDSDLRDFPVLIDITDADVGLHARLDAWDIVFTDYSSGEQLNHEIELYDGGAGHLVAWVNVPFVYSTKLTQLYIYYGNPTVSESQENTTGVWDPSLLLVQHLNETAGIHYDSTSNHNDGTPYGAVNQDCAGKIAGCDEFNGGYVELPRVYSSETQFTFSAWIYPRSGARYIISEWNNYQGAFLQISADSQVQLYVNSIFVSRPITLNEWHYIVGTFDGSSAKLYVDGSVPSIVAASSPTWPLQNAYIGDRSDHQRKFNGFIDEVRLSNPARSSYWIMTEYNNQKDPSTFYTIGPEEVFETPQAPVISNPFPPDGAVSIELNPTLSVDVTDHQGDPLTVTFSTNSTGTWQDLGVYTGGNGVYTQATTTMDYEDTTYWWRVQASDATHLTSQIYQFKTQPDMGNWWNINWKYRRVITIDPSKVSSDQTDFPVVVDLTDSGLTSKAQVDGDDFVFTDENNVKLDHEIESYDSTTGHLIVWVRVPYLSSTTDTVLYMYYGNPKAPNQENPAAVWDASYKLVLHLSETHECRMWGMIADSLPHDVVLDHLIYDPSSLKVLGGVNRDGWGLVWYANPDPEVRRGPTQANLDPNFDLAANEMADSGPWIGVGHVRARSSGGIPPWGDPHPFMRYKGGKWWAFSHNGNLNKDILKSLIGPEYLAANPPTYGTNWDDPNCVDSDLYELYVLKCIEANNWNATLGIAQAITDITKLDSGAANFILTDGETLWGFRKGNTLYYYYKATPPQYSAIASQPPDPAQPGWVQLNDYNLITLTKNNPPSIITDIRQQYPLLVDSDFNNSVDSADLRTNSASQDWYESRNDLPTLLYLDTSNVGGDASKKAGFTADSTKNAYLTQEFSSPQTGTFSASWDIYIDSILDISSPDRAGFMLIGQSGSGGPNRNDADRFVFLGFYKNGGGTTGTMDLVAMSKFDTFTTVASGLNMKQWYTIKVVVNVPAGTYDIYLDGVLKATKNAATKLTSLTHISFAQWNDGAGAFYVDNVFSPAITGYKLTILTEGNGSVIVDPTELSYASGTEVTLTAVPDSGWMFSMWKSNASGSENPIIVTMDGDKTVIANFTKMLLADSEFNDSLDSNDLRNNTAEQDWYESRAQVPTLLFLDETDVDGNAGKKAGFSASASGNAYLTQEFSSPQTGVFSVQWDIYVDSVLAGSASKYRAGQMMIGSTSASYGPNRNDAVRFVFLAFYKLGGGTSGTADLVAMLDFNTQITVASNLNLDQWYTIKVVVNVTAGTYDVYVDGEFKAIVEACTALSNVTHISFAQWDDGAGAFYVDNVFAPAVNRYKLTVNVVGNGSVTVNPGESTYAAGAEVDLTAIADPAFVFSGWSGDLIDHVNPITITMDSDKVVTATFIEPQYALTINIVGTGSVTKNPDKSTYTYGESVNLTASPSVGWSFLYWSGDLSGSQNPATIIMDGDKIVTARFIQEGTCIDSTINGNDGALYGGVTQGVFGIIGGAYEFYGGYVELPRVCSDESSFTFSAWIYPRSGARYIISEWWNSQGAFLQISADSEAQLYVNGKFVSKPITLNEWHYVVGTFDGLVAKLFVDAGISPSTTATSPIWPLQDMYIGDRSDHLRKFNGFIDEVRVSSIARSDSWIATEYNNQHSPSTFYVIAPEETVVIPSKPVVANPDPANGATDVPVTLAELSFTLTDYQGDLMDYYVSTYPDIGGDNATGVGDGRYTIAISGLQYQTTYTWHVNVTDGTEWTNRTFTFTTLGELLVDPELNDSVDSDDLRANSPEQDWYESRAGWSGGDPTLLFLDETDVGGNTGKKAGFKASSSGNAYLTQEFRAPQTGTFTVQWNIYVDSILDISSPDRAGIMLIGSDLDAQKGPSSVDTERFVFMAFYKDGGATSGPVDLVAMSSFSSFTTIASVNLDQWYTIKVVVNVTAGNYAIYVNGVYKATVNACTKLTSVTHISFAQWNDGAGAFYIDNVYASTVKLFALTVNVVGKGLVQKDPDQATYAQGTEVKLTAIADPGWAFAGWSGDSSGTESPTTIVMDSDKTVIATFTKIANEPPVVSNPEPADGATNVPVSTSKLNFTISDADGDLMDYYVSTTPDIGGESQTGVLDGTYSLSVSNLAYGTTYKWWINVTDGMHWTNTSYTFTTESLLLVDSEFNDSADSADLRTNGAGQDWYESRNQAGFQTLLFLDTSDIGGDTSKKAGFTASASGNAYLTQELSSPQTGVFSVQWDIHVDSILPVSPYRAGQMLIGSTSASYGPNRNDAVRFVFLAFYKNGGATEGAVDLVAMLGFSTQVTVASVNLDQWYTIKVVVDVAAETYEVFVDGVSKGTFAAVTAWAQPAVTHISFAQWNDGAGAFYVDNVFSPAQQTNGGGGYPAANNNNHTSASYTTNTQCLLPVFLLPAIPVAFNLRKNKREHK